MNRFTTLLVFFIVLAPAGRPAALFAQAALNMTRVYHYDDNTLPVSDFCAYNDCWGYVDDAGNEYAIIGTLQKVMIFNVTNPATAHVVAQFFPGGSQYWRDFATYGHYLYAVSEAGGGLQVFDLSGLPATVTLAGQYTSHFNRAHTISADLATGRLYVNGSNSVSNGVLVFDAAANGANPPLCGSAILPGMYVHDLYAENNTVYAHHGQHRFYVYNFDNCAAPVTLGSLINYVQAGYCHSGWLGPNNQYVLTDETGGSKVKLFDVSDPTDINLIDTFRSALLAPAFTNSIAHNAFIHDGKVFVAYYQDGLQVFSLANPSNVTRIGYFDTSPNTIHSNYNGTYGTWSCYPFLPSGRIIVSDQMTGLSLIEFNAAPPLPLEWAGFSGRQAGTAVELRWETYQEVNTASFVVERSADGQQFAPVRELPASGAASPSNAYMCIDPAARPGINYYRVKQVDLDGAFSYSEMISVSFTAGAQAGTIKVAPQPFFGQELTLMLPAPNDAPVRAEVRTAAGRLVHTETWPPGAGTTLALRFATPLPAGPYALVVYVEENSVQTCRVICLNRN